MLLRHGNAGSNTAADHITVVKKALAQLPCEPGYRVGRTILICTDGADGSHAFLEYLTKRRLSYSIGFGLTDTMVTEIASIPQDGWTPAYDADGQVRDGAWVAELTDLELRHRRRARCEDRIRNAKATGLENLPLHGFDQSRVWLAVVQLACELVAWTQMLALYEHPAPKWEPKRLRLRLWPIAGRITHPPCPPHPPQTRRPSTLGPPVDPRPRPPQRATHTDLTGINPIIRDEREMSSGAVDPDVTRPCRVHSSLPDTGSATATTNPKPLRPTQGTQERSRLRSAGQRSNFHVVSQIRDLIPH